MRTVLASLALLACAAAQQQPQPFVVGSEENAIQYAPPSAELAGQDGGGAYYKLVPYSTETGQQGLHVDSGYEGYVVPQGAAGAHSLADVGLLAVLKLLGWTILPKVAPLAAGLLLLLLVGGALTTAVCAFTPFCSLTLFPFGRTATQTVRSYLTPDRLTQTTAFVLDAVDKYKELSRKLAADGAGNTAGGRRRRRR